jgi:hypothetical protein
MWADIGIAALLLVGVYCFLQLVGFRSRVITSKSDRRAEDMYDQYADSARAQRRYAKKHGGEWTDDEGKSGSLVGSGLAGRCGPVGHRAESMIF